MPLSVGSRLGHDEVTALIGGGGMAPGLSSTDMTLNRPRRGAAGLEATCIRNSCTSSLAHWWR